jgi:hypothetical protein
VVINHNASSFDILVFSRREIVQDDETRSWSQFTRNDDPRRL